MLRDPSGFVRRQVVNGVMVVPGAMALTRMPYGPASLAAVIVSIATAALVNA